jgi:serine/threonine protein kinase
MLSLKLPSRALPEEEKNNTSSAGPPPRLGLGLRLGAAPLGLGLRLGAGAAAERKINPLANALNAGETLEEIPFNVEGMQSYRSKLYKKKKANGTVKNIRKVAHWNRNENENGFIYKETLKEKRIYEDLKTKPDAEKYIMPYEGANSNRTNAYINFQWLDGGDLIKYLTESKPSKKELYNILIQAATALKWLIEVGGYSHQDIKFDNIYRTSDGKILLLDFGLAEKAKDLHGFHVRKDSRDFKEMLIKGNLDIAGFPEAGEDDPAKNLVDFYTELITFLQAKHDSLEGGRRRQKRKTRKQSKRRKN